MELYDERSVKNKILVKVKRHLALCIPFWLSLLTTLILSERPMLGRIRPIPLHVHVKNREKVDSPKSYVGKNGSANHIVLGLICRYDGE